MARMKAIKQITFGDITVEPDQQFEVAQEVADDLSEKGLATLTDAPPPPADDEADEK